jgi:hypothetical protein
MVELPHALQLKVAALRRSFAEIVDFRMTLNCLLHQVVWRSEIMTGSKDFSRSEFYCNVATTFYGVLPGKIVCKVALRFAKFLRNRLRSLQFPKFWLKTDSNWSEMTKDHLKLAKNFEPRMIGIYHQNL